jgi:threonylcarbamoyladenosine tRNA methylthiotransferase MtaB
MADRTLAVPGAGPAGSPGPPAAPPSYAVLTLGCRVNHADTLALEEALLAHGATRTEPDRADVVIVNSCSVTSTADQGTRQLVRRVVRANPGARVVVTGCYATRAPEDVAGLPGVVQVVPNDRKRDLALEIDRWLDRRGEPASPSSPLDGPCGTAIAPGFAGRTAWTIAVQTGCAEPCSYCVIPQTRGVPRSVPRDRVLQDVARAERRGYREVVVTGVHLGAYGRDLAPAASLESLLRGLIAQSPVLRFRLGSLEPMACTDGIVDLAAARPSVAAHFHLPLQHASDRMLAAMRRPYRASDYMRVATRVRKAMPDAAIGTDVMVGFPGETDGDVDLLRRFLLESPLTSLHVFAYSDRQGTIASRLPGKVPPAAVHDRAASLREVGVELEQRFRAAQVGRVHRALTIEGGTLALTGNHFKLRLPVTVANNRWVHVRVTSPGKSMSGEVLSIETDSTSTPETTLRTHDSQLRTTPQGDVVPGR